MEIRPVGGLTQLDSDGFVVNEARLEHIRDPWDGAVEFLKQRYLEAFGDAVHGIYVRGSVARGRAIAGVSDVDTFALLHGRADAMPDALGSLPGLRRQMAPEFARRFAFATHGELDLGFAQDVIDALPRDSGVTIKTQSVCVHGEDLAARIPAFSFERFARVHERGLQTAPFEAALRALGAPRADDRWLCRRWGRALLRWGVALSMRRVGAHSRDLYYCSELFGQCYPARADQMRAVLGATLETPTDVEGAAALFADMVAFLRDEAARLA